jgi:capsular polysaccharide biosynthesis protein
MPYYHWLLEIVPAALFSLDVRPDSWLLLSTGSRKYVRELADMIAPGRVTYASGVSRVEECIVAAREPLPGFVQRAEIERLRGSFPRKDLVDDWPNRIYVSRTKDATRGLSNETDVEAVMVREGIAVVHTQDLSVTEQMGLFSAAELIVAPHGAGLANFVWADRIRGVVEIFSASYFNDCYARLSRMVGADYRYVVSKAHAASAGIG